jgi:DNA-binding NtrC family response regulator
MRTIEMDVRIIAATSRDLEQRMIHGEFREDLFYRLNVVPLHVPPLRERIEDLESLVESILRKTSRQQPPRRLSARAWQRVRAHRWAGNIRELESALRRAQILEDGDELELEHLESQACERPDIESGDSGWPTLAQHQRQYIERVLERCAGVIEGPDGAARLLGLRPSTLRSRMKRLQISAHPMRRKGQRT